MVCETEKVPFDTHGEAISFALSLKKRKGDKGVVKAYQCSSCKKWHLTSVTKTEVRNRSQRRYCESHKKYNNDYKPYLFNTRKTKKKNK